MREFKNMRIKKNKLDSIATSLILMFNLLLFLRQYAAKTMIEVNAYSIAVLVLGTGMVFFAFLFGKKQRNIFKLITFFSVLYLVGLIAAFFNKNYQLQDFLIPFQYLGVAACLLVFKLKHKYIKFTFNLIIIFFIINIIIGIKPEMLFNISRNYVSVVLLTFVLLYYISCYENEITISIIPALLVFAICMWAVGRSGIIASAVLLLGINFLTCFYPVFDKKKLFTQTILIILLSSILVFFTYDFIFSDAILRFDKQGLESGGRDLIWGEYLYYATLKLNNLFFGVPVQESFILSQMGGNPHNAFIQLHLRYGVIGMLLILLFVVKTFFNFWKKDRYYFLFFIVIILRISTDSGAFNGPFDPFIYYFLFYNIDKYGETKNIGVIQRYY